MKNDIALFCRALTVLDVSQEDIATFAQTKYENLEHLVSGFTEAILDSSKWTVEVESYDPLDVLSDLADILESHKVVIEVDEKDNQIEVFIPSDGKRLPYDQPNREGAFFYRPLVDNECIHDVVFAFELLLPKHVEIYALAYFDLSSSPGYAMLGSEQKDALHHLLRYHFPCVFTKHRPGMLFRKATVALREED